MAKSINGTTKKRGRPKTTGTGQPIHLRLLPDLLAPLDRFAAEQGLSRPAAVRLALREFLISHGTLKPEPEE